MQPLLHSPFLQALGYSIINSLWQFAFLWLVYFALNTIFKLSSYQKYNTGLLLQIAGFTWFLVTLVVYYNESLLIENNQSVQLYLPAVAINTEGTFKQRFFLFVLRLEQFFPYLSIAYLALVFILSVRWIYAYASTQQVRVTGLKEIDDQWRLFIRDLSLQLEINRHVGIYLSELVQTPLTIGFFKPIILIPLATINYLDIHQMEAVIVHELAHIKRYDYLFNLLLALIEACLFFNPFMQLIQQQVKKERENCCDDWVLKYKYCASSYARALLKIASNQTEKPLLALHATDSKKLLITRIKRIIEKNENSFFNHKHQLLALLVLTTVFSALSFLSPSKKATHSLQWSAKTSGVVELMAAKVRNPLFNPVFFLADTFKTVIAEKVPEDVRFVKIKLAASRIANGSFHSATSTTANVAPSMFIAQVENDELSKNIPCSPSAIKQYSVTNPLNFYDNTDRKDGQKASVAALLPENWLPKEGSRQIEIAQSQVNRLQRAMVNENEVDANLKKIKLQLNNALEELKSSKNQVELSKLRLLVRSTVRKTISDMKRKSVTRTLTDLHFFRLNELELLQHEIERQIDSIEEPSFLATTLNA
ncbi:MAG: M56 family metallopeptidase, partial [Bacteroidota bacterium]|nr:M56 family metallopeptidase [Bacteroidota bacterium]